MSDPETVVKVTTSNGGIMEFYPPITVSFITNEFPGQGIFTSHDHFSKPLCQFDELVAGQSYHLLPLNHNNQADNYSFASGSGEGGGSNHVVIRQAGHVRSRSVPTTPHPAPYRMSLDYQYYHGVGLLKSTSTESFSCRTLTNSTTISSSSNRRSIGFWKVRLVITPEKLLEILSQEACTKELIESVRTVAKCGVAAAVASVAGGGISSSVGIVSDQWSLSSSGRSAPSKIVEI